MGTKNPYGEPISNEALALLKTAARGLSHHSPEACRVEMAIAARRWEQDRKLLADRDARAAARNAAGVAIALSRVGVSRKAHAGPDTYRAAIEADAAYSAELRRVFGKDAGDARYDGRGESTLELRRLCDAKVAADAAALRVIAEAQRAPPLPQPERVTAYTLNKIASKGIKR